MATTGTNLSTIKAALQALLEGRAGLAGVNVGYGPPLHADDVTDADGHLNAIWFGDGAGADITIPYLMAGAKVTHERLRFEVVCQSIVRGSEDGQYDADLAAEALLAEVLSELAGDPSLGLTSPSPCAVVAEGYQYTQLDRAANAWGARYVLTCGSEPAGIAAPS